MSLAPKLEQELGRSDLKLAALVPRAAGRGPRVVLSVIDEQRVIAIAKVAPSGSVELSGEVSRLRLFEELPTRSLQVPRVLGWFSWDGLDVLVQEVLKVRGTTARSAGLPEVSALAELSRLTTGLRPTLTGEGSVVVHGDFCGWNTGRLPGDRLGTWDWEWAHLGEPLEDWFHWQTELLIQFGRGSAERLLASALAPNRSQRDLYARLGAEGANAATSLAASLRASLSRRPGNIHARAFRTSLLARLDGTP